MKKDERENWKLEMFSLIKKWKKSGINQRDFCDQHDLSIPTFHYWLRKYKHIHTSSENGFVPVEISPATDIIKGEIQIHYPNGVLLTLSEEASISRIKALIKFI